LKKIDLRDFINFLINPSQEEHFEINSISIFLRLVWKSFLILVLIDIISGILIVLPLRYFNLFPSLKVISFTFYNILKISLLFPIIEELIFRLPLKIYKINLATSLSLILFLVLNKWCFDNVYLSGSFSLVLFLLILLGIKGEFKVLNKIDASLLKPFWIFFYFQALVFGFLHLTNYILDFRYYYLFPFIVISYITKGCFFGYLRVRFTYGIYLSIAAHIAFNSIYCFLLSRW